jgi:hypothetical protein
MHEPIAKQLGLDERQTLQLKQELESHSWLYSSSIVKRALAIYGYAILGYLFLVVPIGFLALIIISIIGAFQ